MHPLCVQFPTPDLRIRALINKKTSLPRQTHNASTLLASGHELNTSFCPEGPGAPSHDT